MLTLVELKEELAKTCDEISLLEILEINSYDLVEAFSDRIEDKYDELVSEFEPDGTSDSD